MLQRPPNLFSHSRRIDVLFHNVSSPIRSYKPAAPIPAAPIATPESTSFTRSKLVWHEFLVRDLCPQVLVRILHVYRARPWHSWHPTRGQSPILSNRRECGERRQLPRIIKHPKLRRHLPWE